MYGGGREQAKVGREEGRVKYETAPTLRDKKQTESKASPACLMDVKHNQKQSNRLHHPQPGSLHVAAMILTGDEGSSSPMSLLG